VERILSLAWQMRRLGASGVNLKEEMPEQRMGGPADAMKLR